jgi:hypothetical protein
MRGSAEMRSRMPAKNSSTALALIAGAFLVSCALARADDCPNARSSPAGFFVERDKSKTEIFYVDGATIRTAYLSGGNVVQETTLFQGLFELERIYQGRRTVFRPVNDLAKFFPLKSGQKIAAKFEKAEADRPSTVTVLLTVKKPDKLYIGGCSYNVLQIDRSVGNDGAAPKFWETDYYSPDLKLIIAKEFKEGSGRTSLNKFDRIYPKP